MNTTTTTARRFRTLGSCVASCGVAGAILLAASPAQAYVSGYQISGSDGANVHSAASVDAKVVAFLDHGRSIQINCQTSGSTYNGSNIWDKLQSGGYVSDDLVNTPVFDKYTPGIPRCPQPPAPPVKTGRIASGNEGTAGQCTWYAISRFHSFSGLYPYLISPGNSGDARYWATNAALDGWTVSATPRVNSIVVFPPGVNGAESDGHVAWVTAVGGGKITFAEMNGTAGPFEVDTRTVPPASTVRYILAP